MPTDPRHIIRLGRAYVRLIEAAKVIAGYSANAGESEHLRRLAKQYQSALRKLLATVSPAVVAEILAGSENLLGPEQDHGLN